MIDSSDTIKDDGVCGNCGQSMYGDRYLQMDGAFFNLFCSQACLRHRGQGTERLTTGAAAPPHQAAHDRHHADRGVITPHQWSPHGRPPRAARPAPAQAATDPGHPSLPPGWFGPDWPPTEPSLLAALGRDAWIHPMAGPVRRMPRADSRVFGAARPGNRAVECRNGHCGVDLGGEIWGEHIRAVHDGVVDRVQRGPNPQHGGRYIRIAHRGGTVFTQYFHLAAIPRGLERGVPVKGGDVVGLLGDSGVKESAPHLHFSVSVRLTEDGHEKYMDPEPLIALWPLRVPLEGSEVGLVSLQARPGVPLGSMPLRSARERRLAKQKGRAGDSARPQPIPAATDDEPSSPESESSETSGDE